MEEARMDGRGAGSVCERCKKAEKRDGCSQSRHRRVIECKLD